MFFILSKIAGFFLQPLSLALLCWLASLLLIASRRRRFGIGLGALGFSLLLVCAFTSIGDVLLHPLESRFSRPDALPAAIGTIVVLGGGFDGNASEGRPTAELNAAGDRYAEALRLALLYPEARLLVSGGFGSLVEDGETDAEIATRFFAGFGIGRDRLITEGASRNTAENAAEIARLVEAGEGEILLITSAFHMPRSVGLFRAAGMDVVPWPVDFRSGEGGRFRLVLASTPEKLADATLGLREWAGLLAYYLTGRIEALLPAP